MNSDPFITFALIIAIGSIVLTVLIALVICSYRLVLRRKERRLKLFEELWEPIILGSIESDPESLPKLKKYEYRFFMDHWNFLHVSIAGDAREGLNRLALRLGIDSYCNRLMRKGTALEKIIAALTLGNLKNRESADEIRKLCLSENPFVSLASARALLQINHKKYIRPVIGLIAHHIDWPPTVAHSMLAEAGTAIITKPFLEAMKHLSGKKRLILVKYLRLIDSSEIVDLTKSFLDPAHDIETIIAGLKLADNPELTPQVREYLNHGEWAVRAQAAAALGRIGSREDKQSLILLLDDPEWWVRFRAAVSLVSMPFLKKEELTGIAEAFAEGHHSREAMMLAITEAEA
jgi:hypothetical protein